MTTSNVQPVVVVNGQQVRCCHCRTDEWGLPPINTPLNERHMGVRFNSHLRVPRGHRWRIAFEGEDVTNQCLEAMASGIDGEPGWVALYWTNKNGKRVVCGRDRTHALAEIHMGRVEVTQIPVFPSNTC